MMNAIDFKNCFSFMALDKEVSASSLDDFFGDVGGPAKESAPKPEAQPLPPEQPKPTEKPQEKAAVLPVEPKQETVLPGSPKPEVPPAPKQEVPPVPVAKTVIPAEPVAPPVQPAEPIKSAESVKPPAPVEAPKPAVAPEVVPERPAVEKTPTFEQVPAPSAEEKVVTPPPAPIRQEAPAPTPEKPGISAVAEEIVTVLTSDLDEVLAAFTPEQTALMNQEAEKTAQTIEGLLSGKIKPTKITKLVEGFFDRTIALSPQYRIQAAKIKTDDILTILKREAAKRQYIEKRRIKP